LFRAGVGNRLLKEILRQAKNANVKFVSIACTSDSMKKLAEKVRVLFQNFKYTILVEI
jgi:hypothetical protein